jgi:CDP-glycerol glycerophosphotransferase (TagB/SpsB family)
MQGLIFFHVPNQLAARSAKHGALLKSLGVQAGVADIIVMGPWLSRPLALEFKSETGVQSDAQKEWENNARLCRWDYVIVRNAESAALVVNAFRGAAKYIVEHS